jgi:hypothetical protein
VQELNMRMKTTVAMPVALTLILLANNPLVIEIRARKEI